LPRPAVAFHLLLLAASAGALPGCSTSTAPGPLPRAGQPAPRPNLFLISVDTLRADHLSSYGYGRPTSPFVDGLARGGIRFANAYAPSSWTVPSMVSMVTGAYQSRHGTGGRAGRGGAAIAVIPAELPLLAELLQRAGYRTYGLTANINVPVEAGFARGFDRFECLGSVDLETVERAIDPWLAQIGGGGEPWFFWLHLFDPHGPYRAKRPWIDEFAPGWGRFRWLDGLAPEQFARRARTLPRPALEAAIAMYDSDIRATDEFLRRVFARFPAAHEALTLFTSDHGEEFLEHGLTLHGGDLYNEQIRVPFVLRLPGGRGAGTVVEGAVSLVDVLPTLLGAAGIAPPAGLPGLDLQAPGALDVPRDRVVWSELLRGPKLRASCDARWKMLTDSRDPGADQLFDLVADPGERTNLVAGQPAQAARRRGLVAAFDRDNVPTSAPPGRIEMTPEQIEKLKALGYVGGAPIGR